MDRTEDFRVHEEHWVTARPDWCAYDSEEKAEKPDLIPLDVMMPKTDGFAASREICKSLRLKTYWELQAEVFSFCFGMTFAGMWPWRPSHGGKSFGLKSCFAGGC
jgi:hypothetical protein